MPQRFTAILFCLLMPGCVIIDVSVTNPIPGLSKIAVVPFRNLSSEPDEVVDGRRIAMAYYSELQKVPGFEVVPVGVAEIAMLESGLKMTSREQAIKLAQILEVDIVVVGSVTEYDPYYPPRIGLQVEWLSPHPWAFQPGVQTDPDARKRLLEFMDEQTKRLHPAKKQRGKKYGRSLTLRGQSPERAKSSANAAVELTVDEMPLGVWKHSSGRFGGTALSQIPAGKGVKRRLPPSQVANESDGSESVSRYQVIVGHPSKQSHAAQNVAQSANRLLPVHDSAPKLSGGRGSEARPLPSGGGTPSDSGTSELTLPMLEFGPAVGGKMPPYQQRLPMAAASSLEPLMSYSRIFDGTDSGLTAELRDYVELNGDLRSGGWEAYLQRSEDFIRFACRRMIVEMLTLHGGEGKRRIVIKWRKYK